MDETKAEYEQSMDEISKERLSDYLGLAQQLTEGLERILTPRQVRERCRALGREDEFEARVIGRGVEGTPIEAYTFGNPNGGILCYGFPDPGEAVGATGIVALMEALLTGDIAASRWNLGWTFVPVLNPDDQPDWTDNFEPVMKADLDRPEVDWCATDPRPETCALLSLAETIGPSVTFPMHDEYHCGEPIPVYFPVSETLEPSVCDAIRNAISAFGLTLSRECHPIMGRGFFDMAEAPDYQNSTFCRLAEYGPVLICEVSQEPGVKPHALVGAQLSALFALLG